jgi:large conductance mechanosensitive channel
MIKGFKEFIMRGNVIDLAVAVVIGAAFTAVINAVVEWLITPLIAAIAGEPNLDNVWVFTLNNAEFKIGAILTQVINFLLVAAAVYFLIVMPINRLNERRKRGAVEEEVVPDDIALLREIRDELRARGEAR